MYSPLHEHKLQWVDPLTVYSRGVWTCNSCNRRLKMEHFTSTELRAFITYMYGEVTLNLSKKGLSKVPDAVTELSELKVLHLYDNNLTELPTSINKLKNLERLHLDGNMLSCLPAEIGDMKKLRWLNVEENQLTVLPDSIVKLQDLTRLFLDGNMLSCLPAEIGDMKKLTLLSVQHNQLTVLPDSIVKLQDLRWLRLGGNMLSCLPAEIGDMKELWELSVKKNHLTVLPDSIVKLQDLTELYLNGNMLSCLPAEIGDMNDLRQLSVSGNPFTVDAMRSLIKLKEKKKGNIDMFIPEIEARGPRAQLAYQKALRDGAVSVYRGRLLLMGQDRAGKTSLKKSLIGLPFDTKEQSTEGIEVDPSTFQVDVDNVKNWQVIDENKQRLLGCSKDVAQMVVEKLQVPDKLWNREEKDRGKDDKQNIDNDAEENEEDYFINQIQKSISGKEYGRHVVRPIFDIDNTAGLQPKDCVLGQSKAHEAHEADKMCTPLHKHQLQQVDPLTLYEGLYEGWMCDNCGVINPTSHPFHCSPCDFDLCHLCARGNILEIQALHDKIMEVLKQEPYMGEKIPVRWIHFEKIIDALVAQNHHHIDIKKLQTYAKDVCFIVDEKEFITMMNFYHDLGIIIKHRTTVVLKAQWLIDLFRQLITIPHFDNMDPIVTNHWQEVQESGVLSMELVDHVFEKFLLQGVVRDDILNMMEQFGLIAKFSPSTTEVKYFVPAQLKESLDSHCAVKPSSSDPCPLYICFFGGFVPHGLFTQLISHFIRWCSEAGPTQPPTLYRNGAWFVIGRQVVYDLILTCKKQFIKVVLKQRSQSQPVLGDKSTDHEVAVQVRELVDETLQSLSRNLPYLRGLQYKFHVECPYCGLESEKCTNHSEVSCAHEDCLHLLEITQDNPLICKKKRRNEVLRVDGLEKWFSLRISQTLNNTGKLPGNTLEPIGPEEGRKRKSPCTEDNAGRQTSDAQPTHGPAKVPRYEAPATTGQLMDDIQLTQGVERAPGHKTAVNDCEDATSRQMTCGGFFNVLQQMERDTRGDTRNTNLSVALKNIASDKGLVVSDNQGGGNCMFHALSEQLGLVKGIRIAHHELRKKVVHYLKNNPKQSNGTELFNFVDGYSSWNTYLTNMKADGTWGDHVILHGVANCFETCIHVVSSLSHHDDVIINPERDVNGGSRLVLGHVHELHYVSLIPLKQVAVAVAVAVAVKEGCPCDEELEELSEKIGNTWKKLGRRLKFEEAELTGFHKENEEYSEKAYAMLIAWKRRKGSAATFQVLHQALCHKLVNRRDLAEEFCEDKFFPCVMDA